MMGRAKKTWKNPAIIFSAALLAVLLLAGPLFAEEQTSQSLSEKIEGWGIEAGVATDVYGKYIWRGQTLVDDPVFQPGAYIAKDNFTASIWGNHTLTDDKEWTEVDYALDYTTSLEFIRPELEIASLSVGYIYYDFPNLPEGDDSQEIYAGIAVDTLLAPSFTVYHDYDEGDGTYYEAGVSHSVPLDNLSLNLSATVGYNDGQWAFDSSWSSALLGVSLTIPLTERVSLDPGVFYSVALDSQYEDEVYAGFSLGVQIW